MDLRSLAGDVLGDAVRKGAIVIAVAVVIGLVIGALIF